MKRFLLTSISAVALTSAASAADLTLPDVPPVMMEPPLVYDWSGIYGGVHAGWAFGKLDATDDFGDPFEFDLEGPIVGGQIGGNIQFGNFVLGVEGDLSLANAEDDVDLNVLGGLLAVNADAETKWMATLRGRAGFAFNRFLVYGTGGLAAAHVETDVDLFILGFGSSDSDDATHVGWTAGGGVESMVTEHITLGLEYLYADFGEEEYSYDFFGGGIAVDGEADLTSHLVRGKVNFKF